MANSQANAHRPKKVSKRQRRNKIIVYIMIIAMVLLTLTTGLALFVN